jgi:glutathione S-transferase
VIENKKLSLYYYDSCPYCRIVLHELSQLNLQYEKRNIMQSEKHYQDLLNGGGDGMVPCLLIEEGDSKQWMYESRDIVRYLNTL